MNIIHYMFSILLTIISLMEIKASCNDSWEFGIINNNNDLSSIRPSINSPNNNSYVFNLSEPDHENPNQIRDTIDNDYVFQSINNPTYSTWNEQSVGLHSAQARFTFRARLNRIIESARNQSDGIYGGRNLATFFVYIPTGTDLLELARNAIDRQNLGDGNFAFTYISNPQGHSERNGWNDLRSHFSIGSGNFINYIYTERQPCHGNGERSCDSIIQQMILFRNTHLPPIDAPDAPFVYYSLEYPNPRQDVEDYRRITTINAGEPIESINEEDGRNFLLWYRRIGRNSLVGKDKEIIDFLSSRIQERLRILAPPPDRDEL